MKFKKTILILFFFILVFSFICSAQIITNVKPVIIADFDEIVIINTTTLKNSDTSQVFDVESTTTDYLTYYFTPKKSLTNGDYELIIEKFYFHFSS